MTPLKSSVLERFEAARLYVITCPPSTGVAGYPAMVEAACQGGADVIQFRDKTITGKERYEVAARLRKICAAYKVLFIVNDALEVALTVEADGVHLGQDDLPVAEAKKLIFPMGIKNFLIGCSTHTLEQAREAARQGADYIGIGPVYVTPTKPTYTPVGIELVRQVTREVAVPHVAIGGIDATNVLPVLAAGARRVAVVRAGCGQSDIKLATHNLKRVIDDSTETPSPAGSGRGRG